MKSRKTRKIAYFFDVAPHRMGAPLLNLVSWARAHANWRIIYNEGRSEEQMIDPLKLHVDGAIVSGVHLELIRKLKRNSVPMVVVDPLPRDIDWRREFQDIPTCLVDSRAIGRFAAEDLLGRQYESFAFVGDTVGMYWSEERLAGFRERLAEAGFDCGVFRPPTRRDSREWATEQPKMIRWLKTLLPGTAVFSAMDGRARLVLGACFEAGISVPHDLGVIGVDDDPAICETSYPRLTSIRLEEQSVAAGEMLRDILDGKSGAPLSRSVGPLSMVMRESLKHIATENAFLAKAIEFIHDNIRGGGIKVPDVVAAMKCSRRFAETLFQKERGRTIREEIEFARFEMVKELLRDTTLSVSQIAARCGFSSSSRLSARFSKLFGTPPLRWRRG